MSRLPAPRTPFRARLQVGALLALGAGLATASAASAARGAASAPGAHLDRAARRSPSGGAKAESRSRRRIWAHLDRAAACQRRGDWSCVLSESDATLAALSGGSVAASGGGECSPPCPQDETGRRLQRRALILRAEALARLQRPQEAAAGYQRVLAVWPGWSPPPDAPDTVRRAFRQARLDALRARLPARIPLPPTPTPPPPPPADLAPPPLLYAPRHLVELDPQAARVRRWRLALGGGAALLAGRARETFAHGALASLELGVLVTGRLRVLVGAELSLHNFASTFRPEPGYGRGLTTAAFTAGVMLDVPLAEGLEAFGALAVGGGMFGARSVAEASGVALRAVAGVRYWVTPALAARLDGGALAIFPMGGGDADLPSAAAHGTLTLRAEARF